MEWNATRRGTFVVAGKLFFLGGAARRLLKIHYHGVVLRCVALRLSNVY